MWFMSEAGDPFKWDYFPPIPTPIQPVSGNNTDRVGRCPDIIKALIPYNDDLMIFGGDRSMWRLTGDPMAGGQFDLISDKTGIAFGSAWARDREGNLYFVGSQGGLFALAVGSSVVRISVDYIERELQGIDQNAANFRLVWSNRDEGLHLFVCSIGDKGVARNSYFWEKKTGGWYRDSWQDTSVQPMVACVHDSDAFNDRRVVMVGEDGFIRAWDQEAADDDGVGIASAVTWGPIQSEGASRETRLRGLEVILAGSATPSSVASGIPTGHGGVGGNPTTSGVRYELYASDVADFTDEPQAAGALGPGHNRRIQARVRGAYVWVRLANNQAGERWAFEEAAVEVLAAGRSRARS
jgi:hypothetical protein